MNPPAGCNRWQAETRHVIEPFRPAGPGRCRTYALVALACLIASSGHAGSPGMLLLDGAVTPDAVLAVGERGTILRSTDHAASWQRVDHAGSAALTAISLAPDARHGWAVGHDAIIVATRDGGDSWQEQWQGENREDSFLDVLALDVRRVIAVGAYGLYLQSEDAGAGWTRRQITEEDFHLNRISRGPTGTLYLAGERGTLLRSTDGGGTWQPMRTSYDGSFFGVLPLDERTLVAHGLRGHVFRSTDGGDSWSRIEIPTPVLLATAIRLRQGSILLAGHARTLLVSRNEAQTFTPLDAPPASAIAELLELPNGGILALGEAGATVLPPP